MVETLRSMITASSATGVNGTGAVSALSSDMTSGLAEPSGKLAVAADISRFACQSGPIGRGSLMVRGRGVQQSHADGQAPAFLGVRFDIEQSAAHQGPLPPVFLFPGKAIASTAISC